MYDYLCGTVNGKIVTEATDLALYNCYYILTEMGGKIEVVLIDENSSEIIIDMPFELDIESKKEASNGEDGAEVFLCIVNKNIIEFYWCNLL